MKKELHRKDIMQCIEFGDYGNYANMIPRELLSINKDRHYAVIKFQYGNSKDRYIDLCCDFSDIDFATFGIKAHKEYILYTYYCGYGKSEPNIVILRSENEDNLIEYRDANAHLLPKDRRFSITNKIVID